MGQGMTDPTVSNVRVTARPIDGPREGLPPCVKMIVFDGRVVAQHAPCSAGSKFIVRTGRVSRYGCSPDHPGYRDVNIWAEPSVTELLTDDPDEAQAAFDKGAEYVRTGEMQ